MTRRRRKWLLGLLAFITATGVFFAYARRTEAPPLPPGVKMEHRKLALAGEAISVSLYHPPHDANAPLVVVAHGFSRSKRYMAGWGAALAGEGFLVAVPTQPALADHPRNARVLAALVDELRGTRRVAIAGFSMGGLTTLLAATKTRVDAWLGLDPVDMDGSGIGAAPKVTARCAALLAEPEAWNLRGNARHLLFALGVPCFTLRIRGATHLDAESPTDLLGQLVCGFVDPQRQAIFRRYAIAFLKAALTGDAASEKILAHAGDDPAASIVRLPPLPPSNTRQ